MSDCTCETPAPTLMGECAICGGFACMYAGMGRRRCPSWRCDCFIETHPDSPFDLHPEAFTVTRDLPPGAGRD